MKHSHVYIERPGYSWKHSIPKKRRTFFQEYWLALLFIGLLSAGAVLLPQWEAQDPGACFSEAC